MTQEKFNWTTIGIQKNKSWLHTDEIKRAFREEESLMDEQDLNYNRHWVVQAKRAEYAKTLG